MAPVVHGWGGGGVVRHYIDRCLLQFSGTLNPAKRQALAEVTASANRKVYEYLYVFAA